MNQLWQFGSKSEEEINAEIEENVSNNTTHLFGRRRDSLTMD
jgi:hypothetical protein